MDDRKYDERYGRNQSEEDRERSQQRRNDRDDRNEAQRQRNRGVED